MKNITRAVATLVTIMLFFKVNASCMVDTTGKQHPLTPSKNANTMTTQDFTTSFLVEQSPEAVFKAASNVRGWWSESVEGHTDQLNAEFLYYYKDVHISKMKIVEYVPNKRIVWQVLDNHFNFTNDKTEWKGNRIVFEITPKGDKTELHFTHVGLVPAYECYDVCHDAWTSYIKGSLKDLITTGKGKPNAKEGGLNAELIEKWKLPKK
ncbi:SRPBCC family protein [Chitinophaga deserti]|uniref:SRPBCC family protein n=1 Tax=Chitinophaga deserti TaxID=2164099 RepID=UPI001E31F376|nr:SRPBCC domain-containing protein [Chitinophaga deserti]